VNPVLVACSHGTSDPAGQETMRWLLAAARRAVPAFPVVPATVDVETELLLPDVLRRLDRPAVVVPLLLSPGHHVHHDIARAVADRADRVAAAPLGPARELTDIGVRRLRGRPVPDPATSSCSAPPHRATRAPWPQSTTPRDVLLNDGESPSQSATSGGPGSRCARSSRPSGARVTSRGVELPAGSGPLPDRAGPGRSRPGHPVAAAAVTGPGTGRADRPTFRAGRSPGLMVAGRSRLIPTVAQPCRSAQEAGRVRTILPNA